MTIHPDEPMHCWGLDNTGGLTKREYFAAMAMQGLLASGPNHAVKNYAACAVEHADALIAALYAEERS